MAKNLGNYADAALIARYEQASIHCGEFVVALGLATLIGWATGIVELTSISTKWVAMQPNTALCLILAGVSIFAASKAHIQRRWPAIHRTSATIMLSVGLATVAEYSLGVNLGIDQFFLPGSTTLNHGICPGRMAVATATNFVLAGAALILLDTRARLLSQVLALIAVGVSTLAILGYTYGVSALYGVGFYSTVALNTAIGTLLVGIGILLVRPDHGVVAILVSSTVGGVLARRLLPLVVATPLLLGWLQIEGERRQFYGFSFGVCMTAVLYVLIFGVFMWRTAEALRYSDDLRLDAELTKQAHIAKLNALIESAMDAIVILDHEQHIIVFNPSAEKMFGYAQAEILGSPLDKLLPQRFRAAHDAQLRAFGVSGSASRRMGSLGSVSAMRADGTEFLTEASISHFDIGQGDCYTAILRDITERTRVEDELLASERRERDRSQELSNLLFAVPAAICFSHDRLLTEVTGNELYERWFSHTADDSGAGPEDDALSGQTALRLAAAGEEIRDYEFTHLHPCGTVRHLFGNAIPLWDDHGVAYGAISAFVDVTELKILEMAMLSVTAGSMAKSDFITHMTHELRTPLGTMLGYAQLLEVGSPSATQLVAIKHIIKAGWYLRDLITEVQELAIIEANSAGLAAEPVSIDALFDDLRGMIAPLVSDAGLRVTVVGINGLSIHANPVRIKQVMLNLLSNAIKYNRPGGSIDVSRVMDGLAQVRIEVRDSGNGLTEKELASLFQPFNRLGQECGKEVGTGVGLVVTKKLVESMGGTIGAESEVGCGTSFWVKVPIAMEQAG